MFFQLYAKKYLKKFKKGIDNCQDTEYNTLVSCGDTTEHADVVQWIEQWTSNP